MCVCVAASSVSHKVNALSLCVRGKSNKQKEYNRRVQDIVEKSWVEEPAAAAAAPASH